MSEDNQVDVIESNPETEEGYIEPTESIEGEAEPTETDIANNTDENSENVDETDSTSNRDDEFEARVKEAVQKQIGKIASKERAKAKARAKAINPMIPLVDAPAGTVYDPATNEYIDANSPIGQIIVREQKIASRKEQERLQLLQEQKEAELVELREKVNDGYGKFNNFHDSLVAFDSFGTESMLNALGGVDEPAAVLDYLGKNQGVLKKIATLTPALQAKEIYKIESLMQKPRKLSTQAKPPISQTKISRNLEVSPDMRSDKQRDEYWENYFNSR